MVELNDQDRAILTCISEGLPDYQVAARFRVSIEDIEETMGRVRTRAAQLDDGSSAAVYYERALRRRAENAVLSLMARFHALMESSSEAIFVINGRSGVIREVNGNVLLLLGYDRGELIGQTVEMLVPEALKRTHAAYRIGFLTSIRKRQMGYHPPIFAVRKDGEVIELAIALTANIADDDVMVVCSDRYRASPHASVAVSEAVTS